VPDRKKDESNFSADPLGVFAGVVLVERMEPCTLGSEDRDGSEYSGNGSGSRDAERKPALRIPESSMLEALEPFREMRLGSERDPESMDHRLLEAG
jgi:hypothetical protein